MIRSIPLCAFILLLYSSLLAMSRLSHYTVVSTRTPPRHKSHQNIDSGSKGLQALVTTIQQAFNKWVLTTELEGSRLETRKAGKRLCSDFIKKSQGPKVKSGQLRRFTGTDQALRKRQKQEATGTEERKGSGLRGFFLEQPGQMAVLVTKMGKAGEESRDVVGECGNKFVLKCISFEVFEEQKNGEAQQTVDHLENNPEWRHRFGSHYCVVLKP